MEGLYFISKNRRLTSNVLIITKKYYFEYLSKFFAIADILWNFFIYGKICSKCVIFTKKYTIKLHEVYKFNV